MHTYAFNANAQNANTSTAWTARSLMFPLLFCFLSFFRPNSHNWTAAKHEHSSEEIYARCVHPSAPCTSESKYEHESCSCHPPGLCSYLRAWLPLKGHRAPCEFLMVLLHWFQNGPEPLAARNKSKCAPPYFQLINKSCAFSARRAERLIPGLITWSWIHLKSRGNTAAFDSKQRADKLCCSPLVLHFSCFSAEWCVFNKIPKLPFSSFCLSDIRRKKDSTWEQTM